MTDDLNRQDAKDTSRRLPNGWRWVRLGEISEVVSKGTTPTTLGYSFTTQGVPFLRAEDVVGGPVDPGSVAFHISPETNAFLPRSRVRPGDLLITIAGTIGRVGYVPYDSPPMNCNQAVAFARLRLECADPRFVCLACRERATIAPLLELKAGGAIQNLNLEQVKALQIPLPPLPEQRRIAANLNEQMAAVERARAAAEARLAAAKALSAAYLRAVFNSPESQQWPKERLGDILRLRKEVIHPRDNPIGRETFVGLEYVESGTGRRIGSDYVDKASLTGRKPQFCMGDIVYGYLRPYLNKVWVAEFDGLCSVDQYVYEVDQAKANTEFIAWFMRSPVYLNRAPIDSTPGQLPRIRTDEVSSVEIHLPPPPEQQRIAAVLNEQMAVADRARKAIEDELVAINVLPAALLRRAFSGAL